MNGLALKKVRDVLGTDLNHFFSVFSADLGFTQAIAYVAAGNGVGQAEYIGLALPGSNKSAPIWLIKKLTYDSSNRVTDIQFAGGAFAFNQVWDDRASLSFS